MINGIYQKLVQNTFLNVRHLFSRLRGLLKSTSITGWTHFTTGGRTYAQDENFPTNMDSVDKVDYPNNWCPKLTLRPSAPPLPPLLSSRTFLNVEPILLSFSNPLTASSQFSRLFYLIKNATQFSLS